ncbi:MAG: outer membrane beta-barrel domain-containing protein [Pseudomonadota bacterium]
METRTRYFLLKVIIAVAFLVAILATPEDVRAQSEREPPLIEADVQPRPVEQALVDSENFEVAAVVGWLNIEDFGSSLMYGARLSYNISEAFFVEAGIGFAEAEQTSFERLAGDVQLLPDDDRDYRWYHLNLGYRLLPGEAFFPGGHVFNTNFYLTGGAGATDFAGDNRFTVNYGAGYQVLFTDSFSAHLNVRQYLFDSDILGDDKTFVNTEVSASVSMFF